MLLGRRKASFFVLLTTLSTLADSQAYAVRCSENHIAVDATFVPSLNLAIIRSTNTNTPVVDLYTSMNTRDRLMDLGSKLRAESQFEQVEAMRAKEHLISYMRFNRSLEVRRLAFQQLTSDRRPFHHWEVVLRAAVYENDPGLRQEMYEFVDRSSSAHQKRLTKTPIPRARLDAMTSLSGPLKEYIWQAIQRAYTWRAVAEIEARVEQIPAEIEWILSLQAQAKNSARQMRNYQNAFRILTKRRLELSDLFFEQQLLEMYLHEQVEFIRGEMTSDGLNAEKFPSDQPPFTPDRPHVFIRVLPGKTINLTRVYGDKARLGGNWFFPARTDYMKSSSEARDTGALPDGNSSEMWKKVTFGEGEEFFVGSINPQKNQNADSHPIFGLGGLGGDIQFWREPIIRKDGKITKKPYFTDEQTGPEVPTLQTAPLQAAQSLLRGSMDLANREWYEAVDAYLQVKERNARHPHPTATRDLNLFFKELYRFHHKVYISALNSLFPHLKTQSADWFRRYVERAQSEFMKRDFFFYSRFQIHEKVAAYDWLRGINREAHQKLSEWKTTGRIPGPIIPASETPKMKDGSTRPPPQDFAEVPRE